MRLNEHEKQSILSALIDIVRSPTVEPGIKVKAAEILLELTRSK